MLGPHHRIAYRLHTLRRGCEDLEASQRLVQYYLVGQTEKPREYVVRVLQHSSRAIPQAASSHEMSGVHTLRCFAALDDDITEVNTRLPLPAQRTEWMELYKITDPEHCVNQPAMTTQLVALKDARYVDMLHIADELLRTFQIPYPHLTNAALALLRQVHVVGATYTAWNILDILHEIRMRLVPHERLMQFALYKPPSKPVIRRGTQRRSYRKLVETA